MRAVAVYEIECSPIPPTATLIEVKQKRFRDEAILNVAGWIDGRRCPVKLRLVQKRRTIGPRVRLQGFERKG